MAQIIRSGRRTWAPNRRSKARMQCWLSPDVLTDLRTQAAALRTPISVLTERMIRAGLEEAAVRQLEDASLAAVVDAVRVTLAEYANQREDRLAKLLVRNIIASDTTRRLLFAHMARQWGGAEQIRLAHDSARTASINALRERGWNDALPADSEESLQ